MGTLIIDNAIKTTYDDRALAHLQIAVFTKIGFGEPFLLTWKEDAGIGGGRTSVWLHPGTSLVFKYEGSKRPPINGRWVHALLVTAGAPSGLYLVPEPSALAPAAA